MFDIIEFFKYIINKIKYLECCCEDNKVYNQSFYNSMPPRTCYSAFVPVN